MFGYKLAATYKPLATTSHFRISVSKRYQRAFQARQTALLCGIFEGGDYSPLHSRKNIRVISWLYRAVCCALNYLHYPKNNLVLSTFYQNRIKSRNAVKFYSELCEDYFAPVCRQMKKELIYFFFSSIPVTIVTVVTIFLRAEHDRHIWILILLFW